MFNYCPQCSILLTRFIAIKMTCFVSEQASTTQMCNASDTVRLAGGQISTEGRVEVCVNGYWDTVCNDGWDVIDGNIVCKQLGFQPFGEYTCDMTTKLSTFKKSIKFIITKMS